MSTARPLDRLTDALVGSATEIAGTVRARIGDRLPSYGVVPAGDVEASVVEIVGDVAVVLQSGTVPPPPHIDQAERSSSARAKQGVPIQDIMQAFRVTMGAVRDTVLQLAPSVGLDAPATVAAVSELWAYSDAYTAHVVAVYRESDIAGALEKARAAQGFLLGVRDGRWAGDATVAAAAAAEDIGLDPDHSHRAVTAWATDIVGLQAELERQVTRHRPHGGVVATIGAQCIGVIAFRPEPIGGGAVVALGPAVRLDQLPQSFESARAVLTAARTLGRTGVIALEDLGWRAAAASAPEVTAMLRRRYLDPVLAEGEFGAHILAAVAAYLAADRHVGRAARVIPVHVNTLRYRLRRFEAVTGASLEATETLVGLSFVLGDAVRSDGAAGTP
ncbi:helix-turn-helix domain-containing protein [Jatrophihabitans sp. YIM 134969]